MDDPDDIPTYRRLEVPPVGHGMRLDRFLAGRFLDRSRSWFARGIREGLVQDDAGAPLRASHVVRAGDVLRLYVDGIAPNGPPPPFPPIVHEDDRVVALDKPAGLLAHPAGSDYAWAVISLAKARWPRARVDLVHRLDRDTSGLQLLTKDLDANRQLKEALHAPGTVKEYLAITKGVVPWDAATLDGPIGPADGPIRIQMAVRPDGLHARTDVTVVARAPGHTLVRCRIHTGRTHQIRVHLCHAGFPLLGDRMYGVPPEVFLSIQDHGLTDAALAAAGAPRQALHAARVVLPHPDGGTWEVEAPLAADLAAWWAACQERRDVIATAEESAMFTDRTFQFLTDLAANNDRAWFEANRDRYEADLVAPALALIEAVAPHLHAVSPHFLAVARKQGGSLFRIYRDTRFSHDKTPYKTHVGVQLRHAAAKGDVHAPGFYLHVEPGDCGFGVGMWQPEKDALRRVRDRIVGDPDGWGAVRAAVAGWPWMGDALKRPPAGYPADHAFAEDLRRKDFVLFRAFPDALATDPDLPAQLGAWMAEVAPLPRFLCDAVGLPF